MFSETKRSQSIKLAQNYLFNKKLVSDLIKSIKICKEDIVFEVGPGRGIITEELLKYSNHIIAIEKDHKNIIELRKKEYNSNFITIIEGDVGHVVQAEPRADAATVLGENLLDFTGTFRETGNVDSENQM